MGFIYGLYEAQLCFGSADGEQPRTPSTGCALIGKGFGYEVYAFTTRTIQIRSHGSQSDTMYYSFRNRYYDYCYYYYWHGHYYCYYRYSYSYSYDYFMLFLSIPMTDSSRLRGHWACSCSGQVAGMSAFLTFTATLRAYRELLGYGY